MNKPATLIVFLFAFLSFAAHAQIITTVAGGGVGDGGPLDSALIKARSLTWHNGNLYISDADNGRVRKIDAAGQLSTIAGCGIQPNTYQHVSGKATAAQLLYPADVAVNSLGEVFIADAGLDAVFKIDVSGDISRIAGIDTNYYNGDGISATAASLNRPMHIVIDKHDNIYIGDTYNNRIRKIGTDGIISTVAAIRGNGLAIDNADNLYATIGNTVYKIDTLGNTTTIPCYKQDSGSFFTDIEVGNHKDLFVTTTTTSSVNRLFRIDSNGVQTLVAGSGYSVYMEGALAFSVALNSAYVAIDHSDNIYTAAEIIRKIDSIGYIHTYAGKPNSICDGATAENAVLNSPGCVAMDKLGNMFIAEQYIDFRIRKVNKNGIISTITNLRSLDMCTDKNGNLYTVFPGIVRKIAPDGTMTDIAGNGVGGYSGDDSLAINARIGSFTRSIAIDNNGNLFIGDRPRIRRIDTNGIITTVAGGGIASTDTLDGVPANTVYIAAHSLAFDTHNNLLVMDNRRIRRIDSNGIIKTIAGPGVLGVSGDGGPATEAYLYTNTNNKMVADTAGNIYFTDARHNVKKIDINGTITRLAGIDTSGFSGDGGDASAAAFSFPRGICVDDSGRLYIADAANARIRRIDTRYRFPAPPVLTGDTSGTLHIFPNPASGSITVQLWAGKAGNVQYLIFDAVGRKVVDISSTTATGAINETLSLPPALPTGVYILKMFTPVGTRTVQFVSRR